LGSERHGFWFVHWYDFGANWRHEILYEVHSPAEPGELYPRCIDGARTCPPDDCGRPENFSPAKATKDYDPWSGKKNAIFALSQACLIAVAPQWTVPFFSPDENN